MTVRKYNNADLPRMIEIWNSVVIDGNAFPQRDLLDEVSGEDFFASQSHCGVAVDDDGIICGLYILHPNNVGRCAHICNASYAVAKDKRGLGIGEALVRDCMKSAVNCGYKILQFNAVVAENYAARQLYEKLGFIQLGTIKGGFLSDDGYKDICPYYITL